LKAGNQDVLWSVLLCKKKERRRERSFSMRTLILAVTVLLLAAPVWATVTITAELDGKVITIGYTSDEGQLIRAIALDVAATGGNIIAVTPDVVGDNNGGYGIFPGSFRDNIVVDPETGEVVSWEVAGYSPVAPSGDPDALGGIGTPGVTIEMGSLYPEGGNAPSATSGTLCTVTVDDDVTEVCITANATRGNVVLEDANEPETLVLPDCIEMVAPDCFPSSFMTYPDWLTYGKPKCWCNTDVDPTATGDYQCDGDGDGLTEGALKYRVFSKDLTVMVSQWKKPIAQVTDPCADFDHKYEGALKYRVFSKDLAILVANWKKKDANLPRNCGTLARPE
jgi:hypothetical protein